MGKTKGSAFERWFARELSLWWSGGAADDLFWRSASSGGRATVRGRYKKTTTGHCGDISPTSPECEALTKVLAFEAKRGYSANTLHDLLDKPEDAAMQKLEEWVQQAQEAAKNARSLSWLILHKRDKRTALVYFPRSLLKLFREVGAFVNGEITPLLVMKVRLRQDYDAGVVTYPMKEIVATSLAAFFKNVRPRHIRELAERISA